MTVTPSAGVVVIRTGRVSILSSAIGMMVARAVEMA